MENSIENCNLSCTRALTLVNVGPQMAKNRTRVRTDSTSSHYGGHVTFIVVS